MYFRGLEQNKYHAMRIRLFIREVNSAISELVYTDRLLRFRYLYFKRKYLKILRLIFNVM